MKLSEFQEQYHWMNGLSEYFKHTGQEERWEHIHKALYHDNWYRKRDVILELCSMRNSNPVHVKSWMNVLLHDKLEDFEIKPQLLATLFRKYMKEDEFLVNVCKFINYWSGENGEAADMPDINDFLSRGQVKSKLWMVSELANIIDGPVGNVAFYGGWYNFLAHFLFSQFDVSKIYSLDIDDKVAVPSKRLYPSQVAEGRFLPVTTDVNSITWRGNDMYSNTLEQANMKVAANVNMAVNTSCEHMNNEWFENLPDGKFVVLQTNDYFSNPQHSNCCEDLEATKRKYPMNNLLYAGELDTQLYNRFMLIGIK